MAALEAEQEALRYKAVETSIAGPLILWLTFLILGVIISLVIAPLTSGIPGVKGILTSISNWILYLPGSVILPLIVSMWIGESVGQGRGNGGKSAKIGEINAVYTSLIYVVAIVIIYLIFNYIDKAALAGVSAFTFVEYSVIVPVVIVLVLTPIVATLSAMRHSAS